ncbi:MAG: hypothetical protein ACLFOC_07060 [Campylobacterales bacterium]
MSIANIKNFISPWFYGYSLQGIAVLGIVPILMPIIVAQEKDASTAGAAGLAFMFIHASWSPLIVGGTAWSVGLSSLNQGETLGIFIHPCTSMCYLSPRGWIVLILGFKAVLLVSLAFTLAAIVVVLRVIKTTSNKRL